MDFVADNLLNGRRFRALTVVDNFSRECLNNHWFLSIEDVQEKSDRWREEYNHDRTHSSLNDLTPAEFIRSHQKTANPLIWP